MEHAQVGVVAFGHAEVHAAHDHVGRARAPRHAHAGLVVCDAVQVRRAPALWVTRLPRAASRGRATVTHPPARARHLVARGGTSAPFLGVAVRHAPAGVAQHLVGQATVVGDALRHV